MGTWFGTRTVNIRCQQLATNTITGKLVLWSKGSYKCYRNEEIQWPGVGRYYLWLIEYSPGLDTRLQTFTFDLAVTSLSASFSRLFTYILCVVQTLKPLFKIIHTTSLMKEKCHLGKAQYASTALSRQFLNLFIQAFNENKGMRSHVSFSTI